MTGTMNGARCLCSAFAQLLIDVGKKGPFELTQDVDAGIVLVRTPSRGPFRYRYDWKVEQWVDITDGHFLLDLLTRDLVYNCNGFPTF